MPLIFFGFCISENNNFVCKYTHSVLNHKIALFLSLFLTLVACSNDMDQIRRVASKPGDPDERTNHLRIFYTDSGYAKLQIYAKVAETFSNPEPVIKMKDSLEVQIFDDNGVLKSVLTAKYGELNQTNGQMYVRDSVRLYNFDKKQVLQTEELHYNQKDSIIYTDKAVVVKTPESIFYGTGLRSKHDFSSYEFIKPNGKVKL